MTFKRTYLLALLAGMAGCGGSDGEKLQTAEVADKSAQLAGGLVREIGSSTSMLTSMTALQGVLSQVPATGGAGEPVPPAPPPAQAALALRAAASALAARPALGSKLQAARSAIATAVVDPASGTDQAAADLETFLRTRVFIESNLESSSAGSATFLLHGSTLCTDGTVAADPACVSAIDDLQLRITATRAGGGFDFAFLVGPARANPVTLGLRPDSFSISVDLAGIKGAAAQVEAVTGNAIPLPAIMEGVFRLAVTRLGEKHVSLAASVDSAIHVRDEATDGTYDLSTQAADPLASVEADAVAGTLTVRVGLGATAFLLPYLGNVATASPSGFTSFGIDLGGLTFTVRASVATPDEVAVTGLGLGAEPSRVWAGKADGSSVDAVTAALNGGDGSTIDVTFQDDPAAGTTLTASPFDLSLHLGLAQLDLDTPPDAGTEDDSYAVHLLPGAADATPVLFVPLACDPLVATCPAVEPVLEVRTGQLEVTWTDPTDVVTTWTVAEGQCLLDDGSGALAAGSCTPAP